MTLELNDDLGSFDIGNEEHWAPPFITRIHDDPDINYTQKPPKIIGPYVLGALLGEGSFGKVKEALHLHTLERVAVKIMKHMKLRRLNNGNGASNAMKEIKLLRALNHKNVIHLHAVYYSEEKKKIYVFIEYCAINMQELLDSAPLKKFPPHQARDYFEQLMQGVQYIHSQSVIHRDIKPGNLLLSNAREVKLADFGIAEEVSRFSTDTTMNIGDGTRPFMSPETVEGSGRTCGIKADVWACGVTLWNFVTGEYPFPFENKILIDLFADIAKGEYTIPDSVEDDLADLLTKMLTVDWKTRISVNGIQAHRWTKTLLKYDSATFVRIPPRNEESDVDRGTTLVPSLDALHKYEKIVSRAENGTIARFSPCKETSPSPRGVRRLFGMFSS
eukprot:m.33295 g.33295  ORF g.33295 m.33295 type:complete len:388 (-) comp16794_c0_seq2:147-1310(-)